LVYNSSVPAKINYLSLHDALPISNSAPMNKPRLYFVLYMRVEELLLPVSLTGGVFPLRFTWHDHTRAINHNHHTQLCAVGDKNRSEEHTSELQSRFDLVCSLRLEK